MERKNPLHVHARHPHTTMIVLLIVVVPVLTFVALKHPGSRKVLHKHVKNITKSSQKGMMGRLIFVMFVILMNLVFQDSTIPNVMSGYIYGFTEGTLLTSVGCSLSGAITFLLSRHLMKDTIEDLVEKEEMFQKIKDREGSFTGFEWFELVALSRLPPIYPYHFVSYFWGITEVNMLTYVLASYVGVLPSIALETYIGTSLQNIQDIYHLKSKGKQMIIIILMSIVATVAIGYKSESLIKDHEKLKE